MISLFFFHFSQNHPWEHAAFIQKLVHSLKNTVLLIIFSIFHEKLLLSCPHLVNKTSIQTKLHYIMCQKVNKMPFLPIFHEKNNALMPIFHPKTSIL